MPRTTNKLETVGKVYNSNDLLLGEICMWTKTKKFAFVWKTSGPKIESDTLKGLTAKMRKSFKWMYIRYKRNNLFNIRDHYGPSKEKHLCWRSDEFYGVAAKK